MSFARIDMLDKHFPARAASSGVQGAATGQIGPRSRRVVPGGGVFHRSGQTGRAAFVRFGRGGRHAHGGGAVSNSFRSGLIAPWSDGAFRARGGMIEWLLQPDAVAAPLHTLGSAPRPLR